MPSQPTPGPWAAVSCRHGWYVASTSEPSVVIDTADAEGRYGAIAREADAKLIAAAPDMLDALVESSALLRDERDCYFEWHRNQATGEVPDDCRPYLDILDAALAKADAAIAKATQS